jgi:hypothetical protein
MEFFFIVLALSRVINAQAAADQLQDTSDAITAMGANAANDAAGAVMPPLHMQKAKTTVFKTVIELKTLTTTLPHSASGTPPPGSDDTAQLQDNGSGTSPAGWWDTMANIASSAMVSMTAPKASSVPTTSSVKWWDSMTNIASSAMVSMTAPKVSSVPIVVVTKTVQAEVTVFADVTVTVTAETTTHAQLQHRAFVNAPSDDGNQ